ncbi:MAG: DUF2029 domain-containing protein [Acidimicrobiia bacterium]|nr:DUF2029 domain-containing protein [Acidimicrobiia bacterium]
MKDRRWLPALFLLVLAAMTIRLVVTLAEPAIDEGAYGDFRDAVYAPTNALLDGVDPYDVDAFLAYYPDAGNAFAPYAPHHLLLSIPLAVLPHGAAGIIWWTVNVALLLALSGFVVKRVRPDWAAPGLFGVATVALLSNPGRFNFLTGQPALAIVLGAYLAFTSSNRWAAAGGTMLALLKPQFGIPLLVLLVASGRWRTTVDGAGLAGLLALPVVVALIFIDDGPSDVLRAVGNNLDSSTGAVVSSFRIDLAGTIARWADVRIPLVVQVLIFLAAVGLGAWLIRRWGRIDAVTMSVIGLVTLLSLFHLPYDELILLWPAVALATSDCGLGKWRWWAIGAMTAAAFNPLTVRFFDLGDGLDTVTTLLLLVALAAVATGILTRPRLSELPA